MPISPGRSPFSIRATTLSRVDRVGDGDRQAAAQHEIQGVGITLVEQDIAANQVMFDPSCGDGAESLRVGVREEVGTGEGLFVSHDVGHGTTLRRCVR